MSFLWNESCHFVESSLGFDAEPLIAQEEEANTEDAAEAQSALHPYSTGQDILYGRCISHAIPVTNVCNIELFQVHLLLGYRFL